MALKPVRVLIVDDSSVVRQVLSEILGSEASIDVVGTACDAHDARRKIKELDPDVLTLDVEMPKMDGISFLRKIMKLRPMPVVMVSALTAEGASTTLDALEIGAVDYVAKPRLKDENSIAAYRDLIVSKVLSAGAVSRRRLVQQVESYKRGCDVERSRAYVEKQLEGTELAHGSLLVALGASTGGTEALKEVIIRLPAKFPPIVIVQHIPGTFSASYAQRLDGLSALTVKEAEHGDSLKPGNVYIAPGTHHMRLKKIGSRTECRLDTQPPVNKHRPSVDVLFDSIVDLSPKRTIAALLTGMGADGARGLKNLRDAGALTIAQDEETCVVWGMPRAAVEIDAAVRVLSLDRIAGDIASAVKKTLSRKARAE